ncbi:MAG: hypothetical protein HY055_15845, partial [Magnetospirillum sp.]|nr:hypothetical protein [Magnetospirillum sp.]
DVNNLLSGHHPASFAPVFVETIKTFVLGADKVIEAEKWDWLKHNLLKDHHIDDLEKELLAGLRAEAKSMPDEMRHFAI